MFKKCALGVLIATASLSVQASELDYSYIQADFSGLNLSASDTAIVDGLGFDEDFSGYDVAGSFGFAKNFYAFAGYADTDNDSVIAVFDENVKVKTTFTEFNVGVGYHLSVSENTDWIIEASYVDDEIKAKATLYDESASESVSDSGFRIASGIRGQFTEKSEVTAKFNYTDVNDLGSGFGVDIEAVYHFTNHFGMTAGWEYGSRDDTDLMYWNVGARFSF